MLKPFYTTPVSALQPNDVFACTVTMHVTHIDHESGVIYIRCYRAGYPDPQTSNEIPQGSRIFHENYIAEFLFPGITSYEVRVSP